MSLHTVGEVDTTILTEDLDRSCDEVDCDLGAVRPPRMGQHRFLVPMVETHLGSVMGAGHGVEIKPDITRRIEAATVPYFDQQYIHISIAPCHRVADVAQASSRNVTGVDAAQGITVGILIAVVEPDVSIVVDVLESPHERV